VALEFNIRDGWHTYWRNPGDSGQATSLKWQLPPGFTAGDIVWTTPHRFELPPLVNYGYAVTRRASGRNHRAQGLEARHDRLLSAKASWLVCSDVCIPEDADLQLKLPASATAGGAAGVADRVDPSDAALFTAARSELPSAEPAVTSARIRGGQLVIALGKEWGATLPQIKSSGFLSL
jgi:DsbC/DsbD-like thiol-disulfide interchange protein